MFPSREAASAAQKSQEAYLCLSSKGGIRFALKNREQTVESVQKVCCLRGMKNTLLAGALLLIVGCSGKPLPADGGTGDGTGGGMTATGGGEGGGNGTGGGGEGGGMVFGDCGWNIKFGSFLSDAPEDILLLNDGSAVVVGVAGAGLDSKDAGSEKGILAARISKQGQVMWLRAYGGGGRATRVIQAQDGDLFISGVATHMTQACANPHGADDLWLAKVRLSDGEAIFKTCIGGDDDDEPMAMREVMLPSGPALHITGSTDSHDSDDVGPKHGGGGFDSPDMMSAIVFLDGGAVPTAKVACLGTLGPESGAGFLDDGSLVGNTFGDDTGDLTGQPSLGYADIWLARWPNQNLCTDKMCTVSALRIGGDHNDAVTHVLPGNILVGDTRSRDGGMACATATSTSSRAYLAKVGSAGFDKFRCLEAPSAAGLLHTLDAVKAGNKVVVAVSGLPGDGDFSGATAVDAGTDTSAGSTVVVLDTDLENITRRVALRGLNVKAIALRDDGCLLVTSMTRPGSDIGVSAIAP